MGAGVSTRLVDTRSLRTPGLQGVGDVMRPSSPRGDVVSGKRLTTGEPCRHVLAEDHAVQRALADFDEAVIDISGEPRSAPSSVRDPLAVVGGGSLQATTAGGVRSLLPAWSGGARAAAHSRPSAHQRYSAAPACWARSTLATDITRKPAGARATVRARIGCPLRGHRARSYWDTLQSDAAHASQAGWGPSAGSLVSLMWWWAGAVGAPSCSPVLLPCLAPLFVGALHRQPWRSRSTLAAFAIWATLAVAVRSSFTQRLAKQPKPQSGFR